MDNHFGMVAEAFGAVLACKVLVVGFDPAQWPREPRLYSDAAVTDLLPVLRMLVRQLERGDLRLPKSGGYRLEHVPG